MLKGRGKIFAPKAPKGRPRPGSARPSVERQSQTPAPREESVAPIEKEPVPETTEQSRSDAAETTGPSTATLKRKADTAIDPPAKRVAANIENQVIPETAEASRVAASEDAEVSRDSVPTVEQSRHGNLETAEASAESFPERADNSRRVLPDKPQRSKEGLKRKSQEEDAVEPPAKRLAVNIDTPAIITGPAATPTGTRTDIDDDDSQSSREPTPDAPAYRYPSPINIIRIVDDVSGTRMGSMGPAGGAPSDLGRPGEMGAAGAAARALQISELIPMAALNPDGTSGGLIEEAPSGNDTGAEGRKKGKRKYTKKKKVQVPEIGDDGRPTVEMQLNRPRRKRGEGRRRRRKDPKEKKNRAETPEGAEDEEIDPSQMTMTDLCKDLKIGKPFIHHKQIKARAEKKKQEYVRARLRKIHPELAPMIDAEENPAGNGADARAGAAGAGQSGANGAPEPPLQEQPATSNLAGPRMRIVNGNIVVDEHTLQIDRQKQAQAGLEEREVIEENDFTRVITSGTWMKMERAQAWDTAAVDLFYSCLRQHGTDFETIAHYFPHRNRRQIKLKYNKEERSNPARIHRALTGVKEPIDMDDFAKFSNRQLEEVADIEKERAEYDQAQEAEFAKQEAAREEERRRKKEAIHNTSLAARRILATVQSDDEDEEEPERPAGNESAKENRAPARSRSVEPPAKGRKKAPAPKKPRKNKHSYYAGGEEVEVLGTIE